MLFMALHSTRKPYVWGHAAHKPHTQHSTVKDTCLSPVGDAAVRDGYHPTGQGAQMAFKHPSCHRAVEVETVYLLPHSVVVCQQTLVVSGVEL